MKSTRKLNGRRTLILLKGLGIVFVSAFWGYDGALHASGGGDSGEAVVREEGEHWLAASRLHAMHPLPPPVDADISYEDLDEDGDPDILKTQTVRGLPILWIDDDDDMLIGDVMGDFDSDCLMIDRNRDGHYGSVADFMVDHVDTDGDGKADLECIADIPAVGAMFKGHYMWVVDTDDDGVFNCIDWDKLTVRAWLHDGSTDFYQDYHGNTLLLKIHGTPSRMEDPRLNWENPFLFYDADGDGLTEVSVRLLDEYKRVPQSEVEGDFLVEGLDGKVSWISAAFDMDRDNGPGNEFDLDMTIGFRGEGFSYLDQRHRFAGLRGLPAADKYFADPSWRQLEELVYADHDAAWDLIFDRGKWTSARFVYDEDDDCGRWERVEFYEPLDPFKIGFRQGGVDSHRQADTAGDRGEWDADNSGGGNLYISRFDGRIHLLGAEWGVWRIDQNAWSYQGVGGWYDGYGPGRTDRTPEGFATVRYEDTDQNGFLDQIEYDLDGDHKFERTVSLLELGLEDRCEAIATAELSFDDFHSLQRRVSEDMWKRALEAVRVAETHGIESAWYARLLNPTTVRQKYRNGYWVQFYLYCDLQHRFSRRGEQDRLASLDRAYFSGDWSRIENR